MINILIDGPSNADTTFVFAHGAGAGMEHEFMQFFASQIAAAGIQVIRFEFPYMAKRRLDGRKYPPNRQPQAMVFYSELLTQLALKGKIVVAGKSMGGRIASLITAEQADDLGIAGLVCLGFPFYAPKKNRSPESSRGEHLYYIKTPTLILQGQRDNFGRQEEVLAMPFASPVRLAFLNDGDHGFKPRVKSGFTLEQNMQEALKQILVFVDSL